MAPLRGWGRKGEWVRGFAPHGHWRTLTFLALCAAMTSRPLASSTGRSLNITCPSLRSAPRRHLASHWRPCHNDAAPRTQQLHLCETHPSQIERLGGGVDHPNTNRVLSYFRCTHAIRSACDDSRLQQSASSKRIVAELARHGVST